MILLITVSNEWKDESLRRQKSLSFYRINQYIVAFLRPPKEAGRGKLWKLLITVYGIFDDPSAWYFRIKEIIQNDGASKSKFVNIIFCRYTNGKLEGIICWYFDILELETMMEIDLYIEQKDLVIRLNQIAYINK